MCVCSQCHSGILGGGHYVTYAKNPNRKWYCYNDSSCKVNQLCPIQILFVFGIGFVLLVGFDDIDLVYSSVCANPLSYIFPFLPLSIPLPYSRATLALSSLTGLKELSSDEIDTDSAYILFYEQQGLDRSLFMPKTEGKKMADTSSMDEDFEMDYKKYCVLQ